MYGDDHIEIENMSRDRFRHARALGYRSGLEVKITNDLKARGVPFEYEPIKLSYLQPGKVRSYAPDIVLGNGIIIEVKGIFERADRQKHLLVKEQHPNRDIRFLFQSASKPIYKGSKTTYARWCEDNGIKWCEKRVPQEWIDEART